MKIPKCFHPILGILIGSILFCTGIGILSCAFVGAIKAIEYAKAVFMQVISNLNLF